MSFEHTLYYSLTLPMPRAELFDFFADAANLQLITPPELDFTFVTPLPIEMRAGAIIDYRLRLKGLPFNWRSEITAWHPPEYFVDEQIEGPYRKWVHRHTFIEVDGGTTMEDEVHYRLPLLPFGEAAHPMVRQQLERIFSYRQERVQEILLGKS